jgi:hypothetical protein
MFVWYLDRGGKLTVYQLEGQGAPYCFPTREYANACAEQLVRDRYTTQTLVLNVRGQVMDVWKGHGRRVRHVRK